MGYLPMGTTEERRGGSSSGKAPEGPWGKERRPTYPSYHPVPRPPRLCEAHGARIHAKSAALTTMWATTLAA